MLERQVWSGPVIRYNMAGLGDLAHLQSPKLGLPVSSLRPKADVRRNALGFVVGARITVPLVMAAPLLQPMKHEPFADASIPVCNGGQLQPCALAIGAWRVVARHRPAAPRSDRAVS